MNSFSGNVHWANKVTHKKLWVPVGLFTWNSNWQDYREEDVVTKAQELRSGNEEELSVALEV